MMKWDGPPPRCLCPLSVLDWGPGLCVFVISQEHLSSIFSIPTRRHLAQLCTHEASPQSLGAGQLSVILQATGAQGSIQAFSSVVQDHKIVEQAQYLQSALRDLTSTSSRAGSGPRQVIQALQASSGIWTAIQP